MRRLISVGFTTSQLINPMIGRWCLVHVFILLLWHHRLSVNGITIFPSIFKFPSSLLLLGYLVVAKHSGQENASHPKKFQRPYFILLLASSPKWLEEDDLGVLVNIHFGWFIFEMIHNVFREGDTTKCKARTIWQGWRWPLASHEETEDNTTVLGFSSASC